MSDCGTAASGADAATRGASARTHPLALVPELLEDLLHLICVDAPVPFGVQDVERAAKVFSLVFAREALLRVAEAARGASGGRTLTAEGLAAWTRSHDRRRDGARQRAAARARDAALE